MNDRTCKSCKYSSFTMTKHDPPRINTNHGGVCEYIVGPLPVPASIDQNALERLVNPYKGRKLDPVSLPENCAVWERREI